MVTCRFSRCGAITTHSIEDGMRTDEPWTTEGKKNIDADYCQQHAEYLCVIINGLEHGTKVVLDVNQGTTQAVTVDTLKARAAAYREVTGTPSMQPLTLEQVEWLTKEGHRLALTG